MRIKNNLKYLAGIVCFLILVLFSQYSNIHAETSLTQNDKGQYCIKSADDFITFLKDENKTFRNKEQVSVILNNDISISDPPKTSAFIFKGTFDGNGKTISFTKSRFNNINESLFPFFLYGKIKNVKIDVDCTIYNGDLNNSTANIIFRSISKATLQGITIRGNVKCIINDNQKFLAVSASDAIKSSTKFEDCEFSLDYKLENDNLTELAQCMKTNNFLIELYQIGGRSSNTATFQNCFSNAVLDNSIITLYDKLNEEGFANNIKQSGIYIQYINAYASKFLNYYYNKETYPNIELLSVPAQALVTNKERKPSDIDSAGRTTSEMKSKNTYVGFDFDKKWSISDKKNNGYPYYDPRVEEITLEIQADVEPKIWSTGLTREYNRFVTTSPNFHFPYRKEMVNDKETWIYNDGDHNKVNVIGAKIVNQTEKQKELIAKYGITAVCNPETDVKSATIDVRFVGKTRPLAVEWVNEPTLKFPEGMETSAENDGYIFKTKVINGTGEVKDTGERGAANDAANWNAYLENAQEAIDIILDYCKENNAFGPKDSPSYGNTDIWAIFTAARCGYIPYDDDTYFDRWFANTKIYLQNKKDEGTDLSQWQATELSKLILAIESIGYDPRDISSVNLLDAVGKRNGSNYLNTQYAIHAIKSGNYTASTFSEKEMETWVHEKATDLLNAKDSTFTNADNTMNYQPLVYWYGKEGFGDVTEAIKRALKKFPEIAQRSTGSFCTVGHDTECGSFGNNAWNDAQAMIFAGIFNVNVLDYGSGYTKNGNNIIDAFFDLVNLKDRTIHGFTNYDVPQIARGLNAFVRQRKGQSNFWDFSDVKVPTKSVNDMILALNDNSTKEEIEAARNAYNALDEKHKAIFNKDTLRKLLAAENGKGDSITKVIAAIDALPAADKLTLEDKDAVVKARNLYDALDDEAKSVISNYSKLTEAEARIKELEKGQTQKEKDKAAAEKVVAAINALPSSDALTLDPYVLQLLDNIQAEYNALTEAQKALVTNYSTLQYLRNLIPDLKAAAAVVDKIKAIGEVTSDNYQKKQALVIEARTAYDALTADQKKRVTNYAELEKAELFISRQSTDEKVAYVITFIDELNITTSSTGALSDGPLKLTEKNNNVPTEKIWNDWMAYVVNARALYNTLDDQQKAQVTNLSSLEKAEGYLYQLKSDALKAMLKALPDAETVRAYEAPQPTTVPAAQEAVQSEELPAQEVPAEGSDFSDGSADAFTSDISEQPAAQMDIQSSEDIADVSNEETPDSVIADEAEVPDADFSTEEEIPAAGDTAKRALTETELKQIVAAKNAYDQLTETEETKFRSENTALVENMEKLIAMALTYEKGQNEYQQLFADEAALIYATVKDHPVDRDSYPQVKAFLDRYAKDYQGQENAMAGLKVKVGNQEMTFAEVIAALTAQADKAGKDISDAQQADDWISNLPTAVTKENIAGVEAELAALQKLIDSMSAEGKSYMWNAKQLELIKTIVADYHIELAGKQDAFKADMPANLQTKALNYKTIQVSWSSVDNADGYMVYRRTETGSWKKIADQVTDISYKDQKAVTGRVYYYTVRAYSYTWGGKTVSSYDKDGVIGKAKLGKVKIAATDSENYTTIRVTWNKVSGANGYRVYRSASKDGKYTAIGSTAKNSAVTFLDKKAATGTTYYYKVRAYRNVNDKKIYGSSSTAVKGKAILSVPALSVGSTSKTAVLEWSKVKGADGYQVYASASKNGKYIRIKATKGTGMTEEKLATGKTRYYKVRAYRKVNGKAVYGSFSKVKKVVIK